VFSGPVTYASLHPLEHVDWDMFDLIGINHYWREPVKDRYLTTLEPLLASGKPVVITEFGFRTRTGADQTGPAGPENIDPVTVALHMLPLQRGTAGPQPRPPARAAGLRWSQRRVRLHLHHAPLRPRRRPQTRSRHRQR
jgi:hypothetical protein